MLTIEEGKSLLVKIPNDMTLTTYSPFGSQIDEGLANAVATNNSLIKNVWSRIYQPGEYIPNYTYFADDGTPIFLSDMLKPGMGDVHWGTCTFCEGTTSSSKIYTLQGVFDETDFPFID